MILIKMDATYKKYGKKEDGKSIKVVYYDEHIAR